MLSYFPKVTVGRAAGISSFLLPMTEQQEKALWGC